MRILLLLLLAEGIRSLFSIYTRGIICRIIKYASQYNGWQERGWCQSLIGKQFKNQQYSLNLDNVDSVSESVNLN